MKKIILFCFISLLICSCSKENVELTLVKEITPSQSTALLTVGDSLTLTLSCTPANLSAPTCVWTSSDPTVAIVDYHGKIKALSRGTTTINIVSVKTQNDGVVLNAQCKLTVTYKGDGSTSNPYLIYTVADLKAIRDSINTKNDVYGNKAYKLMNDLDFSKETSDWTPIGNIATATFKGSFDGNGKTISNIRMGHISQVNGSGMLCSMQYAGLFGIIDGAIIKNIEVDWIQIMTSFGGTDNCYAGGIAGYGSGTISNCTTNGDFACQVFRTNYVGGIIGYGTATTTIDNCHYNSGFISYGSYNIVPGFYAGGIAGYNTGTISNCSTAGTIGASWNYNGGIVGYSIGTIVNCFSTALINCASNKTNSGGIAGYAVGTIINCYSTGRIRGSYTGGIAGQGGDITNCYASGDIYGFGNTSDPKYAGGIAGTSINVNNCIALNSSILAFPETEYSAASGSVARICCLFLASDMMKNNYAATSIIIKKNGLTNVTVTDFSDNKLHGFDLTAQPVDLLNAYVSANPTFNNIGLKKWKVTAGVNNGYPVFE
jgi:hypothetical protein